jgi:hypothetical protein
VVIHVIWQAPHIARSLHASSAVYVDVRISCINLSCFAPLVLWLLLLSVLSTDEDGCALAGTNRCANDPNSNGTCLDMPAPLTGYKCVCKEGTAWDAFTTACTACVSVVAGSLGYGYSGDNGPATSALLHLPMGVSVDAVGNFYIAGKLASLLWCEQLLTKPKSTVALVLQVHTVVVRSCT